MTESRKRGSHEVRYESDTGYIFVSQDGVMEGDDARFVSKTVKVYSDRTPGDPVFILCDASKANGVTREARQVVGAGEDALDEAFVALFGASLPTRTIFNLIMKAVALTTSK